MSLVKSLVKKVVNPRTRGTVKALVSKSGKRRAAGLSRLVKETKKGTSDIPGLLKKGVAFGLGAAAAYKVSKHKPNDTKLKIQVEGSRIKKTRRG